MRMTEEEYKAMMDERVVVQEKAILNPSGDIKNPNLHLKKKSKFPKYHQAPPPVKPETAEEKRDREIREMSEKIEKERLTNACNQGENQ